MLDRFIDPDDYYERPSCRCCEEKEQTFDYASEFLEEVISQLYSEKELDKSSLENALDELCYLLKVKMGQDELQVERKRGLSLVKKWITFNNDYLYKIAK